MLLFYQDQHVDFLGLFCLKYTKYTNVFTFIRGGGWGGGGRSERVWRSFKITIFQAPMSEEYSESSQTFEMELFAEIR